MTADSFGLKPNSTINEILDAMYPHFDGDRSFIGMVFRAGVEAERARAAAETTDWSERGREVAHADFHGQEGNLLGAKDCDWEGCRYIEHAEHFAGHLDAWRDERQAAQS